MLFHLHQKSCRYSQRFSQIHVTIFSKVEEASGMSQETDTYQAAMQYPFQVPL